MSLVGACILRERRTGRVDTVTPGNDVRVLGVTLSWELTMDKHVSAGYYRLRQLRRVRRSLDSESMLVYAFVTSRVDYCNALLTGAPKATTDEYSQPTSYCRGVSWMRLHVLSVARGSSIVVCRSLRISTFIGWTYQSKWRVYGSYLVAFSFGENWRREENK